MRYKKKNFVKIVALALGSVLATVGIAGVAMSIYQSKQDTFELSYGDFEICNLTKKDEFEAYPVSSTQVYRQGLISKEFDFDKLADVKLDKGANFTYRFLFTGKNSLSYHGSAVGSSIVTGYSQLIDTDYLNINNTYLREHDTFLYSFFDNNTGTDCYLDSLLIKYDRDFTDGEFIYGFDSSAVFVKDGDFYKPDSSTGEVKGMKIDSFRILIIPNVADTEIQWGEKIHMINDVHVKIKKDSALKKVDKTTEDTEDDEEE